ncbi:uncharacterized protein [Lolium perenne]|uniref:uncharacterized protein n=1 Tax=Lolium perenne TaxID=4522 RepID=UPI0021F58AA4|nr:uncharacterized protein LOC127348817 isoform X2 [Lolium perenne]
MAKPHAVASVTTQRPSSTRSAASARNIAVAPASDPTLPTPTSTPRADLSSVPKAPVASAGRSSVGSSSVTDLPTPAARDIAYVAKDVAKWLANDDDDSAIPTFASRLHPVLAPEGLAGEPEPEDASTVVSESVSPADAVTAASADSTVTQIAAPGDSTADFEAPLLTVTEMEHVLAELGSARGLSPRSKRLLTTLVQVADAELTANPTAAAVRMRRAARWRKVRVGILAAAVFSVAVMDVALAVALFGAGRGDGRYHHVLPPT